MLLLKAGLGSPRQEVTGGSTFCLFQLDEDSKYRRGFGAKQVVIPPLHACRGAIRAPGVTGVPPGDRDEADIVSVHAGQQKSRESPRSQS